jgi:hypothetical protein
MWGIRQTYCVLLGTQWNDNEVWFDTAIVVASVHAVPWHDATPVHHP